MQEELEAETKSALPQDSTSQPLPPTAMVEPSENDDDPDEIFLNAVAEIDTQPLVKVKHTRAETTLTIGDVLEIMFLVSVLLFGLGGSMYLAITYPHTLVLLYAKAYPASITTTLDVPTRTLAPVTITRSLTAPTTGTGYQKARAATGTLIFYNGLSTVQSVPAGTIVTGQDGIQVVTDTTATIAADNPPNNGEAHVSAHAVKVGRSGNIVAEDINLTLSAGLYVKNLAAFANGQDARTFRAVAAQDLQTVTTTLDATVTQAFPTAFTLQPGEAAIPTTCTTKATPTHQPGDEATSVTVTTVKTCSAVAYNQDAFTREAKAAFTQTRPGAKYQTSGSVSTTVQSVSPLTVTIRGKWMYTFSPDYEQSLAEKIAGDTPAKARTSLLKTGRIAYASVPSTLPPDAMYIDFLVLVG